MKKRERKILYADWDCFGGTDIRQAFADEGRTLVSFPFDKTKPHRNDELSAKLQALTEAEKPDFLFSFNYFPVLSGFCRQAGLPYCSWVYDSPYVLLYSSTLINPCNHVFLFDRAEYEVFRRNRIPTVRYLPLAADPKRLGKAAGEFRDTGQEAPEVSFVGSMYTEEHNFYDRLSSLSERAKGYLEGLMEAQLHLFGANIISEVLPEWVMEEMARDLPMQPNPDGVESLSYLFSEYVINRKLTSIERKRTLEYIAENTALSAPLALYTPDASYRHPGIENRGCVDYLTEMPGIFARSKINLNISLRSIHTGIPLRCFDILGAGGFLITNYQADLTDCFTPGEDLVVYTDIKELPGLISYYLAHEEERMRIAENGKKKLESEHTYRHRIRSMMRELENAD